MVKLYLLVIKIYKKYWRSGSNNEKCWLDLNRCDPKIQLQKIKVKPN